MNINDIMNTNSSTLLVVSAGDLKECFKFFLAEAKESLINQTKQIKREEYKTPDEVCVMLNVTRPTLWRWDKSCYLSPVKVGSRCLYKMSDINKMLEA